MPKNEPEKISMICPNCKIEVSNMVFHDRICMVKNKETKPEKFVEPPTCKKCGIVISQNKWDNAIKAHWLPLCDLCEPELKEKFKLWMPLFQKFKFPR